MSRRKNPEIEVESSPQSDLIVCPVCGKEFRPTEETYCWVQEGRYEYKQVCSWACFKKRVDEVPADYKTKTVKKDTVKVDLSKAEETNENEEETKEEENENA